MLITSNLLGYVKFYQGKIIYATAFDHETSAKQRDELILIKQCSLLKPDNRTTKTWMVH